MITELQVAEIERLVNAWLLDHSYTNDAALHSYLVACLPDGYRQRKPRQADPRLLQIFDNYRRENRNYRQSPHDIHTRRDLALALYAIGARNWEVAAALSISRKHAAVLLSRWRKQQRASAWDRRQSRTA
jgi:hypothetical protein